jgi:predicted transcriptional regulator
MTRRLHIGVRSREDSYTAALHALQRAEARELTAHEPALYFESLTELRQTLTTERLDLLIMILRHTPSSVLEIAKLVGRDLTSVSEDLTLLHQLGLVEFVLIEGQERAQTPVVPYDEIALTIDLRALAGKEAA